MLRLYYKIWTDAIVQEQSKPDRKRVWKLYTIIPISILEGFNLLTIFYWMRIIVNRHLLILMPVHIFNARPLNGFISVLITYFIPFLLLNYLLIIFNDRWKKLIKIYGDENGKLYKRYTLITIGLLIIPVIIQVMFFK